MNETMTHECFSENDLLISRISRQVAASENQNSVLNSRHIGRVAHDSDKIARNRLDTSGEVHAIFARASICFHYLSLISCNNQAQFRPYPVLN